MSSDEVLREMRDLKVDMRAMRSEMKQIHADVRAQNARHDERMKRLEQSDGLYRRELREREERYRADIELNRTIIDRNERIFREGTTAVGEVVSEMRAEIRAQTDAIFALIDRLENGGASPAT